MLTLDQLQPGQRAEVLGIEGDPALVQRLYEMGLFEGESLEFLTTAPLGDPLEVRYGNTRLSLRRSEARCIRLRLLSP